MNILTEGIPEYVIIGGLKVPVATDFRVWIKLEELLLDDSLGRGQKAVLTLELVYPQPVPPMFLEEALEAVFWFYNCGQKPIINQEDGVVGSEVIYSYEHDAGFIYAAFLEQYGIDLLDIRLHWWKFRALLKSLKPDTLFVKIMGYRAMKITADMSLPQKEFYTKMKKLYALPVSEEELNRKNTIEEALMNGGDLSGLL